MNRKIIILGISLLLIFVTTLGINAQSANIDIDKIIKKLDRLYRSDTSYAEMDMTIITPNWKRTLSMKIWTEGMTKTFIYILAPKKDEGIATLRIDNEMWNYFPNIDRVMKVPPSMMMGSWMGSDFTNDDLVKESTFLEDYDGELFQPQDAESGYCYVRFLPKKQTVTVWDKIEVMVKKDTYIPVKETYFDEKGNPMRVMYFKEEKIFGDRRIPAVMEMVPLNKKNHKTIIRYKEANFDIELTEDVFTLRNLQKRR